MESLEHSVARLGGVATRQQLIAAGAAGVDITRAVRTGRISRVRQARYVIPSTRVEAVVAARVGGRLGGPSAARTYGLWGGFDQTIHVVLGENSSRLRTSQPPSFSSAVWSDRPRRRVQLHWVKGGKVPELGPECWRVSLADSVRQTFRWCGRETALACADVALTRGIVDRAALLKMFADEPQRLRLLVRLACAGSGSGAESIVARRLRALGLVLIQQFKVAGVGHVDIHIRGTRLMIEVDGRTYHQDPEAFEEDRRRDAELVARGYIVVRLSYLRVATDWAWCERMVLSALAHA